MSVIGIVRGENTSKVNLIVTWQKHVLTWSQSTDLDPPLPLFWANNVQSLRAAVETEENPARQMAPRRSVLQVAAQSFTYTDNLNNSWSRKCGRRHKIEKTNPPQKWVSVFMSSQTAEWGKALLRVACFGMTVTLKSRVWVLNWRSPCPHLMGRHAWRTQAGLSGYKKMLLSSYTL